MWPRHVASILMSLGQGSKGWEPAGDSDIEADSDSVDIVEH